jgi:hypothetical protein
MGNILTIKCLIKYQHKTLLNKFLYRCVYTKPTLIELDNELTPTSTNIEIPTTSASSDIQASIDKLKDSIAKTHKLGNQMKLKRYLTVWNINQIQNV